MFTKKVLLDQTDIAVADQAYYINSVFELIANLCYKNSSYILGNGKGYFIPRFGSHYVWSFYALIGGTLFLCFGWGIDVG